MEKRTALAIGALTIVVGLALTGVVYATTGTFTGHYTHNNGMMGRAAGNSGGMMGGHDGMNWSAGNASSCYSYMQHDQGSNHQP